MFAMIKRCSQVRCNRNSFSFLGCSKLSSHNKQTIVLSLSKKGLDSFSGNERGTVIPRLPFVHSGKLESSKYCFNCNKKGSNHVYWQDRQYCQNKTEKNKFITILNHFRRVYTSFDNNKIVISLSKKGLNFFLQERTGGIPRLPFVHSAKLESSKYYCFNYKQKKKNLKNKTNSDKFRPIRTISDKFRQQSYKNMPRKGLAFFPRKDNGTNFSVYSFSSIWEKNLSLV